MTAERLAQIEYEVDPEELVQLLAAPDHTDPREITDPIAVFGTKPLEDSLPLGPMPTGMAFAG